VLIKQKHGRKFTKSSTKTEEVLMQRPLAAESPCMEHASKPVNSKGGPEYVEDLCPLYMPCDMDRDNYTFPPFCSHPAVTAKPTA
jgi:hypothetical protein